MKISVIICTHNRANSLAKTLSSVLNQSLEESEYEIIVVDNASTDATKSVVDSQIGARVKYVYEATLGLSYARNTGWKYASSEYVAFLDDDTTVSKEWLSGLLKGFQSSTVEPVCVGGKVTLALPSPKPAWLDDRLQFCLGALDRGDEPIHQYNLSFYLHGCNMAFTKATLVQFDGFSSTVGRYGKNLLSGEDVLLQIKIIRAGGELLYQPNASVVHHIVPERLTKKWYLKRMYWEGVSLIRVERAVSDEIRISNELRLLVRESCNRQLIFELNFAQLCFVVQRLGRIFESMRLHS